MKKQKKELHNTVKCFNVNLDKVLNTGSAKTIWMQTTIDDYGSPSVGVVFYVSPASNMLFVFTASPEQTKSHSLFEAAKRKKFDVRTVVGELSGWGALYVAWCLVSSLNTLVPEMIQVASDAQIQSWMYVCFLQRKVLASVVSKTHFYLQLLSCRLCSSVIQ